MKSAKKDYILIISGLVPIFFSIFIAVFVVIDRRSDVFKNSPDLDETNEILTGQMLKFQGRLSEKNKLLFQDYILAMEEKFFKSDGKTRSEWRPTQFFIQDLDIITKSGKNITVQVAKDYLPCGREATKLPPEDKSRPRYLGIKSNETISGFGKVITSNPIVLDSGHSICTGSLEVYETDLGKKRWYYILMILGIGLPGLGLIYLGVKGKELEV